MKENPLASWNALIAPLVDGLGEALLPWLERLDLALGPLAAEDPQADGDPDGFVGLSRRGPYERLLLGEWLLATEAPDEFLRRAASGEHAFLELARRSPAGSRVTAVFFDAGPWQVGAPRLAHLALLLVMARRAQAAGARFFWGVLQHAGVLHSSIAPELAAAMLGTRSRLDPERAVLSALDAHRELARARRELWLVGGPSVAAIAPGPFVEIGEPLDAAAPALLRARIRRPDRGMLEVDLPLPPEDTQVRALREPFRKKAPERRATPGVARSRGKFAMDGRASLFFSGNGRRLFAGVEGGGFVSHPVPNSPYASPAGEPLVFHSTTALGAGVAGKRLFLLRRDAADSVTIAFLGRRGGESSSPLRLSFAHRGLETGGALLDVMHSFTPRGEVFGVLDPRSASYFSLSRGGISAAPAVAAARANQRLVHARSDGGKLLFLADDGRPEPSQLSASASDHKGHVFFGHAEGMLRHAELGLCAVERRDLGDWAVLCNHQGASCLPMAAPPVGRVLGVMQWTGQGPVLVVLADDRRTLLACGPSSIVEIAKAASPIVAFASSTQMAMFAYTTEDFELVVRARNFPNQPILRVLHGR